MTNPALTKYLAPILQFAVLLIGGLQLAVADNKLTTLEAVQLGILGLGLASTYLFKLAGGPWPAILKTGSVVVLGVLAVLAELLIKGAITWDAATISLVVLAGLNALAAEIGVAARLTATADAVANPNVENARIYRVDSAAYDVVTSGRHAGK